MLNIVERWTHKFILNSSSCSEAYIRHMIIICHFEHHAVHINFIKDLTAIWFHSISSTFNIFIESDACNQFSFISFCECMPVSLEIFSIQFQLMRRGDGLHINQPLNVKRTTWHSFEMPRVCGLSHNLQWMYISNH